MDHKYENTKFIEWTFFTNLGENLSPILEFQQGAIRPLLCNRFQFG